MVHAFTRSLASDAAVAGIIPTSRVWLISTGGVLGSLNVEWHLVSLLFVVVWCFRSSRRYSSLGLPELVQCAIQVLHTLAEDWLRQLKLLIHIFLAEIISQRESRTFFVVGRRQVGQWPGAS